MAGRAAFWDKHADGYAARPIRDEAAYEATLARARAHLSPDDVALEIGCGTGGTAVRLAPAVGRYLATDLSPRMIEIARARPEAQGAGTLTFAVAEAGEAGREPFDAVLAFNVLHLLEDLPRELGRIAARLRPGGRLISKTPCLKQLSPLVRLLVPAMRLVGLAPPVIFLGAGELEAAIEAAGFRIVETGDYPASRAQRLVVAERARAGPPRSLATPKRAF